MKTEHILIIRFSALGDVAMTVPVVASLARQYPHVRISVLSRPVARPFFEHMPPNVSFMPADIKGEYHGLKGLNALYRRLMAKKFTAIADFHDVLRSEYLRMRFNFDRYRVEHIDKHRSQRRALTSTKNKVLAPLPSQIDNYLEVLRKLGYPVKLDFHSIFPAGGGDLTKLPAAIGQKAEGQRWIGIAPFAAHEGKVYPMDKMEQVIKLLIAREPSCRIFLFGGRGDEEEQMNDWARRYPQVTAASPRLGGIANELILMSHLDVMLSMDSANMHMASLVGTRVVSVWGATHPFAGFMGYGQSTDDAIQLPLSCRPCSIYGNRRCQQGNYPCLNGITPESIVEKI